MAAVGEKHRAGDEYRFVYEERKLSVGTGRQQERRRKAAADRHQRQALRTMSMASHAANPVMADITAKASACPIKW